MIDLEKFLKQPVEKTNPLTTLLVVVLVLAIVVGGGVVSSGYFVKQILIAQQLQLPLQPPFPIKPSTKENFYQCVSDQICPVLSDEEFLEELLVSDDWF